MTVRLTSDSSQVVELKDGEFTIQCCPNASYGYLYIGAVELPVKQVGTYHNTASNKDEQVFECAGVTYVWGPGGAIVEPGTKGKVTCNNIGPGVVVGYQSEKYGDSGHLLLNLLVALDKPPAWWTKQTFQRELDRAMKEHIVAQKCKWQWVGFRRELVPTGEPDKDSLKRFKANYKDPPCIVWGDSFKVTETIPVNEAVAAGETD